ncbi:hypothetical protein FRC17_005159 [Serendipita sp. 399]|nr:hypothetical protein FRC17_005159 [Serendipita sp. 399]
MAAKEDPSKRDDKKGDEGESVEPEKDDILPQEDEGPDTENLPNEAGGQMENLYQEEEILDLPDDLDMGQDESKADGDLERDDEDSSYEGELENATEEGLGEEDFDFDNHAPMDVASDGAADDKEGDMAEPTITAEPDKAEGQGQQDTQGGSSALMEEKGTAPKEQEEGVGEEGQNIPETEAQQQSSESQMKTTAPNDIGSSSDGPQSHTRTERVSDQSSQPMPNSETSGQRALAEAFAEVQRRYQEILEQAEQEHQRSGQAEENTSTLEYAGMDAMDAQAALASAQEEEVARLRDLNLVDEKQERELEEDVKMVDIIEKDAQSGIDHKSVPLDTHDEAQTALEKSVESALIREDIHGKVTTVEGLADASWSAAGELQKDVTSEDVEARLVSWQRDPHTSEDAASMWRLYSSLTHELAWTLCEQLRLILEPTKATRLKGDYRTGKRLNMRKIIPYIASEYTKDKIWLRRTRPSQREYQILLALDDSRSMSESHSEHLAFETLALVSKALTRLEAGDIFVARFGETVELLHGVDDGPFNDAAGARVVDSFAFDQTSTDVLALVEISRSILQEARDKRMASTSAADLWQLEIIISDGVCSNHDKLRAAIRRAREQKILIVFIIIDAIKKSSSDPNGSNTRRSVESSILTMKQVKQDLSIERYLDTFPFEYYVVLRSVDALPEVLSATLKQFFQHIAEE